MTRGGRCNIAHCPRADIFKCPAAAPFGLPSCEMGPLSPFLFGLSALPACLHPRPRSHKHAPVVYTRDSRAFAFFSSSLPLPFRPGRLSFRRAREPLISADFARRADPWNPRGYLSPGGSFLSFSLFLPSSLPPSYSAIPSRVPPEFFTHGPRTAPFSVCR